MRRIGRTLRQSGTRGKRAKIRRFYNKLGIGDRTEIEHFDGPHTINGQGTFDFLHKHLNLPKR